MLEELRMLVELQTIDSSLHAAEKFLQEIPQQRKRLEADLATEETIVENQRQKVSNKEKEQRKAELDMKSAEEAIDKYQHQLFACKNNKEYEAVQHEIQTSKDKISSQEEKILVLMDELEKDHELLAEEEIIYQDKKKESAARLSQLEAESQEKQAERDTFRKEREEIASNISPQAREFYEKIANFRNQQAVVGISMTSCNGCYNELPPQMINDVMQNNQIYTCQACGRILYWKEESLASNST